MNTMVGHGLKAISVLIISLLGLAMVVSCSASGEQSRSRAGEVGRVRLPLIAVGTNERYRMQGTLTVRDSATPPNVVRTITIDPDTQESELEFPLEAGRYTMTLENGWQLDRSSVNLGAILIS
jgi:hypothetical protein